MRNPARFLRNAWYVAAWSEEVGRKPLARRLLDQPLALFRDTDGAAHAIGDICPHRFASLSAGAVVGDALECPYHGLRFAGDGACVHNPHGDGRITPRLRVAAYPLVERHGLLWIWMGDARARDDAAIPDFAHLVAPERAHVRPAPITVQAHYELVIDNLMDLSHLVYVHSGTAGLTRFEECVRSAEALDDGAIVSRYEYRRGHTALAAHLGDATLLVDSWFDMEWRAPGNLLLRTGATRAGTPREEGAATIGSHLLTPETERSTHYFICNSRAFALDDPDTDAHIAAWQENALRLEDKVVLETVQRNMGTTDLLSLEPALLDNDRAAMLVRRRIVRLLRAEQDTADAAGHALAAAAVATA